MKRATGSMGAMVATLMALLFLAGSSQAAVTFQADLNGGGATAAKFKGDKVVTDRGVGFRSGVVDSALGDYDSVEYAIVPGKDFAGEKGSISLAVRRDREGGESWHKNDVAYNTLFTFLNADRMRVVSAYILWNFVEDVNGRKVSGIHIDYGVTPASLRGGLWGTFIPFDSQIKKGEWIDLTFTWGPEGNGILLNGARLKNYYTDWDEGAGLLTGKSPLNVSLGAIAGSARYLVLGTDVGRRHIDGQGWKDEGIFPLYNSVLYSFSISDSVVTAPLIASLTHNADTAAGFSGALVEGDELAVALQGSARGRAFASVGQKPDRRGEIGLDWRGYYDEDVNIIKLDTVDEYRVYLSPAYFTLDDVALFHLATDKKMTLPDGAWKSITAVEALRARDMIQTYRITGLDYETPYFTMVTAVDTGGTRTVKVGGQAVGAVELEEALISPVGGIALTERVDTPGTYAGVWKVGGDVSFASAVLIGSLANAEGLSTAVASDETFAVDTSVRILVKSSPSLLKADESSTARLTVEIRDANGDTVSGHKVALSLATTSEYTGVIGGGKFRDAVGGGLALDFSGVTDAFGTVQATFTAGFAAKTAIIVARDRSTNDVGAGFVQQYIEGSTDIELVGLRPSAAKVAGYSISVTSDKPWLTADGSSQAKIRALVLKNGAPVAGHTVVFSIVGEGRIKTVNAVTDASGSARAVYTAGTKIGLVLVKATDVTIGLSGSTQIELRSDAPAKIAFAVEVLDPIAAADSSGKGLPELYADGRSLAKLTVLITDINDNPNADTTVAYAVSAGSGSLQGVKSVTDKDGKSYATFKAGLLPGKSTVKVTVSSNVPNAADTAAAENAVLTVPDFEYITE